MRYLNLLIAFAFCAGTSFADDGAFSAGPVFKDFGPVADVEVTMPIPADTMFRHSFDVSSPAAEGAANTALVSAARFINMHARSGVAAGNIRLAIVVHGQAVTEMADSQSASATLVTALVESGTRIIVCGQSAARRGVATEDLLPGVEMALSAMTAHALLQQQGYTLNPF